MPREGQALAVPSRQHLLRLLREHGSIRRVSAHLGISHALGAKWYQRREIDPESLRPTITEQRFRREIRAAGGVFLAAAAARDLTPSRYRRILRWSGITAERQRLVMDEERRRQILADFQAFERAQPEPVNSYILLDRDRTLLGRIQRVFGSWSAFEEWRQKGKRS